jgi:hypothetical protein
VELLHRLWLDLSERGAGHKLHHRDVVRVALQRLEAELHSEHAGEVVSRCPGGVRKWARRERARAYNVFRYATRSDIWPVVNRGHGRFFCSMRSSIRGPCFHNADTTVMEE